MAVVSRYSASSAGVARLDALVDGIVRNPGRLIQPGEFAELEERLQERDATRAPADTSDEDFVGALMLILASESVAETGAAEVERAASANDAAWLTRWIRAVWLPDELTHAPPYRAILLSYGLAESELDRLMSEAASAHFSFPGHNTPFHVTAYGMVQEYITDYWHGRAATILKPSLPEAALIARRIKQRETLHSIWCRDMTAIQLEDDPTLMSELVQVLADFRMPGHTVAPELYAQSSRWVQAIGLDAARVARELTRLLYSVVDDPAKAGKLLVSVAEAQGRHVGPVSASQIRRALDRLGSGGYGLVGEALLEHAGLGYLYRDRAAGRTSQVARLRGLMRSWLARYVSVEMGYNGAPRG